MASQPTLPTKLLVCDGIIVDAFRITINLASAYLSVALEFANQISLVVCDQRPCVGFAVEYQGSPLHDEDSILDRHITSHCDILRDACLIRHFPFIARQFSEASALN